MMTRSFSRVRSGYQKWDNDKERSEMGENIDEAKGRAKQAAGDLADDEELKREGRVDRAVSDVKDKVDDIADKVKDRIGKGGDDEPERDEPERDADAPPR
jgi:uncharacterized protein YjbJ (UPF0337 family)